MLYPIQNTGLWTKPISNPIVCKALLHKVPGRTYRTTFPGISQHLPEHRYEISLAPGPKQSPAWDTKCKYQRCRNVCRGVDKQNR